MPEWPWEPEEKDVRRIYRNIERSRHKIFDVNEDEFVEILVDGGPFKDAEAVAHRLEYYRRYEIVPTKKGMWG